MQDRYRISGYEITSDPQLWTDLYHITPELEREMPELETKAKKGKISAIRKFHNLIKQHPKNPQLKNLLSVLYNEAGHRGKAEEVNRWIEAEHPDYLFGKLNRAATYYQNEEYEKMPAVLGDVMELKEMAPERDTFFISEFLGFNKLAALYFAASGDIEQANIRLDMMKEVAPDHPDTEYVNNVIFSSLGQMALNRYAREEESRITPENQGQPLPAQRKEAPELKHAETYELTCRGWDFTEDELEKILRLPRESLIADLEKLLEDAIVRFHYFEELDEEKGLGNNSNFPLHALLMLGELKAEESLPGILRFLRYKNEFVNFWLGDTLTELMWHVLYKTAQGQLYKLRDFLLEPNLETFCKTPASQALSQLALHQPERRAEILSLFKDVLNGFAKARPGDGLLDSDVAGFIIGDLLDFNAHELRPEMKKLFELGYVGEGICGAWEDVEFSLEKEAPRKEPILSLQEQYAWLQSLADSWEEEDDSFWPEREEDDKYWRELEGRSENYTNYTDTPIVKPKKVGRNDPCPCGSGKKYKKCCG